MIANFRLLAKDKRKKQRSKGAQSKIKPTSLKIWSDFPDIVSVNGNKRKTYKPNNNKVSQR